MRTFPLSLALCGLGVSTHSLAQSITSAPATAAAVPVDHPLALMLLAVTIGLCAFAVQRKKHRVLAALLPVMVASLLVWQSSDLRAIVPLTFTNPAGETLTIPVTPISGGFDAVDYFNDSGTSLVIQGIVLPDQDDCAAAGPAGASPQQALAATPPTACTEDLQLPDQAVCRVDVDAICRDLIDYAPTVTTVNPANGAVLIASNTTIEITFSESVDISSAADFNLECGGQPRGYTITTPATLPASTTTIIITPAGGLPEATTCTVSVLNSITDSDSDDPPNNMAATFTWSFTIAEPPP